LPKGESRENAKMTVKILLYSFLQEKGIKILDEIKFVPRFSL